MKAKTFLVWHFAEFTILNPFRCMPWIEEGWHPCKVIHYRRSGQSIHHIAARKRKCFASMKRYCKYWIIIPDNFLDDFSGTLDDQLRNTTYEKVGSFVSIRCATRGKLLMEENELLNFGNLKFYSLYCNN